MCNYPDGWSGPPMDDSEREYYEAQELQAESDADWASRIAYLMADMEVSA